MKKHVLPLGPLAKNSTPIWFVEDGKIAKLTKDLPVGALDWAKSNGFEGKPGSVLCIPDQKGGVAAALFGIKSGNYFECGKLSCLLPAGNYHLAQSHENAQEICLGFALGSYGFDTYKKVADRKVRLAWPNTIDRAKLQREIEATFLVRDLINTPTNDMGPNELESEFRKLATRFKAKVNVIKGNDLLKKNFPMIHAVGRASADAPRLLDMKWGKAKDPKITLVGKGVCFDTGGLNIKPGGSMTLMKKDMGGAANVLGLALLIMAANLPVRLRVLIPAVENSISANAFRPGDILPSRKGISVEIGNTDAEGRLVLGDALAYGDEENPDLMIDMATLTGAARVALGPDLPPFYTDDEKLAAGITKASENTIDPLWRKPLWEPYDSMLNSKIADTNHITAGGFAGSVTAALFLKKFVKNETPWVHFDVFGWVPSAKPWAPVGGEAQGIRALFELLQSKYGN